MREYNASNELVYADPPESESRYESSRMTTEELRRCAGNAYRGGVARLTADAARRAATFQERLGGPASSSSAPIAPGFLRGNRKRHNEFLLPSPSARGRSFDWGAGRTVNNTAGKPPTACARLGSDCHRFEPRPRTALKVREIFCWITWVGATVEIVDAATARNGGSAVGATESRQAPRGGPASPIYCGPQARKDDRRRRDERTLFWRRSWTPCGSAARNFPTIYGAVPVRPAPAFAIGKSLLGLGMLGAPGVPR